MSDALQRAPLFHRMRHTPLRDVLRGRLTGRLDLTARLAASGLPAPATALISRVTRRTRLWRLEKVDVADELIAHFADGLAAGETADDLISLFGDERTASKLIRRAKWRGRPIATHLAAAFGWMLAGLFVAYVAVGVYFHTGRPTPKLDFIAMANARALNVPAADRAWPIYREAILSVGDQSVRARQDLGTLLDAPPGHKRWPELVEWVNAHTDTVRLIREASRKPTLGFIIGPGGSADDPALADGPVVSVSRPHDPIREQLRAFGGYYDLHHLLLLSSILTADARVAREAGAAGRLVEDLAAADLVTKHMLQAPHVGIQRWALTSQHRLTSELDRTLTGSPALLSDDKLRDFAHRLAGPNTADDLFDLTGNRMEFHNAVQLLYTDDGDGDGHLTAEGLDAVASSHGFGSWISASSDPLTVAVSPAVASVAASRRDTVKTFNRLCDEAEARLAKPIREIGTEEADEFEQMHESRLFAWRHIAIRHFMPQTRYVQFEAERQLARRDAVLVAIALELHRRRHGGYPESLDPLVPGLLPSVPLDRISGDKLSYRLEGGKPVVYSVGSDRDNDGGRTPVGENGELEPWSAAAWSNSPTFRPADGDWVLYPEPVEPECVEPAE